MHLMLQVQTGANRDANPSLEALAAGAVGGSVGDIHAVPKPPWMDSRRPPTIVTGRQGRFCPNSLYFAPV